MEASLSVYLKFIDLDPAVTQAEYVNLLDAERISLSSKTHEYNEFAKVLMNRFVESLDGTHFYARTIGGQTSHRVLFSSDLEELMKTVVNVIELVLERTTWQPLRSWRYPNMSFKDVSWTRLADPRPIPVSFSTRASRLQWAVMDKANHKAFLEVVPIVSVDYPTSLWSRIKGYWKQHWSRNASHFDWLAQNIDLELRVWNTPMSYRVIPLCHINMSQFMKVPSSAVSEIIQLTRENMNPKPLDTFNKNERKDYDIRRNYFAEGGSPR